MDARSFKLLNDLTSAIGVSGREERIRQLVINAGKGLFDKTETDALGNFTGIIKATKKPSGSKTKAKAAKKILLACHMDEIGFYVKHIDDKGFIRLNAIGGVDPRNLTARNVIIQGKKDISGVLYPSVKPLHLTSPDERDRLPKVEQFFVDTFLDPKEVKKQIRVGDPVAFDQHARRVGSAIVAKTLDNRMALFTGIMALKKLKKEKSIPSDIYFVATVQEEVGCRGAGQAAFAHDPDVAIAVDVTIAADTPGMAPEDAVTQFGGGAAIKIMDGGTISTRKLVDEFVSIAEKNKIPHQLEILPRGGTDARPMQLAGAGREVMTISVPCRYVHTACESVHIDDLQAAIDLLAAYMKK